MKHPSACPPIPSPARPRPIWCLVLELLVLAGLILTGPALTGSALAEVRITDDRGRDIRLERPAIRVIALYGAFNEILADLGREDILVARTEADELPPSIRSKPAVGTHLRPNPELILSLNPDLVLQLDGRAEAMEPVAFLEEHGIPTAVFRMETFADLFAVMERLGVLSDSQSQAASRVRAMRAELEGIRARRPAQAPSIFFEIRHPNLLAAGQGAMVSEIMAAAGGRNAVTAPDKLIRLSEEEVLRLDPDIYLIQHGPMNPAPTPMDQRPTHAALRCVRQSQVFTVDQQLGFRPGPGSREAVRQLADIVSQWAREDRP